MLYILAGTTRSGKSLLTRKLNHNYSLPHLSTDYIFTIAKQGAGDENIEIDQEFVDKAERLWKYTKPLIYNILSEQQNYIIEGDAILPKHINELGNQQNIQSCFLGFSNTDPQQKLHQIRKYEHLPDSWTKRFTDEDLLPIIEMMIDFSLYLKEECQKHKLPYIEVKNNLKKTYEEIVKSLKID